MNEEIPVTEEESTKFDSQEKGFQGEDSNSELPSNLNSTEVPPPIQEENDSTELPDIDPSQENIHGSKIGNNEARLEQLEKEHETLRSQYMRIAADFDNFRKRQTRDQDDLRLQLTCSTLSAILPVVDNFERARQQLAPEGEEAQALHRSYQGLYKQLVEVLKQLGVAPMRVEGQSFDPTLHEAVLREPSEDKPEDMVIEELQRGYHLNGRVLRHALVKVSMGPGPASQTSPADQSKEVEVSNSKDDSDIDNKEEI